MLFKVFMGGRAGGDVLTRAGFAPSCQGLGSQRGMQQAECCCGAEAGLGWLGPRVRPLWVRMPVCVLCNQA